MPKSIDEVVKGVFAGCCLYSLNAMVSFGTGLYHGMRDGYGTPIEDSNLEFLLKYGPLIGFSSFSTIGYLADEHDDDVTNKELFRKAGVICATSVIPSAIGTTCGYCRGSGIGKIFE